MQNKNILKSWKFWIGALIVLLIIAIIILAITRNTLTSEETVSRFMYLVENKEYVEAKKMCTSELEFLDLLSNVKPSSLNFEFSEDKEQASTVLLEEEIEETRLNVKLKNTILGWKIESYEVITDLINPQTIEDKLKTNKIVSDIQMLYWGESEAASKEEIKEYAKDNGMVALIFIETIKAHNYTKSAELYNASTETALTINELQGYNWNNYKIVSNFEIMQNLNGITVDLEGEKIYIVVAGKEIISVTKSVI